MPAPLQCIRPWHVLLALVVAYAEAWPAKKQACKVLEPDSETQECHDSPREQVVRGSALLQTAQNVAAFAKAGLDQELNASLTLSNTMQQLAAQLPEGHTKELLKSFRVCTSCSKYKRFGELHDGGYLTCMDGLEQGGLRAAYSMGVAQHDKFSLDMYNSFHVPVYQFDCTVDGAAQMCADCHFKKVCLKGASGGGAHPSGPNWDMAQVLQETGQAAAPRSSLLMKMDIEGAEWNILADGGADFTKFKQLIFEFHWLDREEQHELYARATANLLNAGFRVSHIHGNNYAGMYNKNGFAIPNVIEATFLLDSPKQVCNGNQDYNTLDQPNNPDNAELPMAKLF